MKAVFDTNIIVSSVLSPGGHCAELVDLVISEEIDLITCSELSAEYREALARPPVAKRHGLDQQELDRLVELLNTHSLVVEISMPAPRRVRDPDDDKVVACAIAGDAEFIVSGDHHLLDAGAFDHIEVLHPQTMLTLLHRLR